MSTKKTYKISKTRRLIDLNGSTVNFELQFSVRSVNNVPFQATVVDQSILDSGKQIEYQLVKNGTLTGTLTHDDNMYQNFFLVLKADNDCNCEVELTKNEIAGKPSLPPPLQEVPKTKTVPVNMIKNPSEYDWSKVLLTVVVIAGLCLAGYWFWTKYTVEQIATTPRSFGEVDVPKVEEVSSMDLQEVDIPRFELQQVELPDVELPVVELPKVELPKVELPKVELPKVELPKVELPKVEVVNPLLDKLKRLKLTS